VSIDAQDLQGSDASSRHTWWAQGWIEARLAGIAAARSFCACRALAGCLKVASRVWIRDLVGTKDLRRRAVGQDWRATYIVLQENEM
jgi:hypothetical protein